MNQQKVYNALTSSNLARPFGYLEFFACTWMCSHVRFCRAMWDADDYSREEALAWILNRNQSEYITSWRDSLIASTTSQTTVQNLRSSIEQAVDEIQNSDYLAYPQPFRFESLDVPDDMAPYEIHGLKLYSLGPSQVFYWEQTCGFNYLEIHWES